MTETWQRELQAQLGAGKTMSKACDNMVLSRVCGAPDAHRFRRDTPARSRQHGTPAEGLELSDRDRDAVEAVAASLRGAKAANTRRAYGTA